MRTTIVLPEDLKKKAMKHARSRGVSLSGLIRTLLTAEVELEKAKTFLDLDIAYETEPGRPHEERRSHNLIYDYHPRRKRKRGRGPQ